MKYTYVLFIRKADNLISKLEYIWLNAIIYIYTLYKKLEFYEISKSITRDQFYYYIKCFILLVNYYISIIALSEKSTKNINKNHIYIIIYNANHFY